MRYLCWIWRCTLRAVCFTFRTLKEGAIMMPFTRVALVFLLVCLAAVAQQSTISTFAGGGLPIGIPGTSASLNVAPTDKDYVWNNKEGDTPALFNPVTKVTLDSASY